MHPAAITSLPCTHAYGPAVLTDRCTLLRFVPTKILLHHAPSIAILGHQDDQDLVHMHYSREKEKNFCNQTHTTWS